MKRYFKTKLIRSIVLIGREWTPKSGTTECSVSIIINGEFMEHLHLPPTTGYGEYYKQYAFEHLDSLGILDREQYANVPLWRYCELCNIKLHGEIIPVSREKDL